MRTTEFFKVGVDMVKDDPVNVPFLGGLLSRPREELQAERLICRATASARPNLKNPTRPKFKKTCAIPQSHVLSGNSS